ncbi:MAG: R3H domain-containing nucleic acid-binding protein [Minisyncoccia bacterium]
MEDVEKIVETLLETLGVAHKGVTRLEVAGQIVYSIGVDDGKTLIGAHGDTVHAIDFLVKRIVEQKLSKKRAAAGAEINVIENEPMFLVDVNDYRTRQIRDLQNKALMMAERARSFQYDVELTPMSGYERLIVHTTLQDAPNVKTESQGEGRNRRVVIRYTSTS